VRPLPRKTSKPAATRPAAGGRPSNAPASRRGPLPRRKDRPWGWITGGELVTAKPKGGRTRTVPLPDVAAVALAEHLRTYPAGGLVFSSRERRPLNRNYVNSRVWKPALVRAGVEPTRDNGMHALRHYFASVLIDAGGRQRRSPSTWGTLIRGSPCAYTPTLFRPARTGRGVP